MPNKTTERRRNHVKSFLSFSAETIPHFLLTAVRISLSLSLSPSFSFSFASHSALLPSIHSLVILALIHHFGFLYILPLKNVNVNATKGIVKEGQTDKAERSIVEVNFTAQFMRSGLQPLTHRNALSFFPYVIVQQEPAGRWWAGEKEVEFSDKKD